MAILKIIGAVIIFTLVYVKSLVIVPIKIKRLDDGERRRNVSLGLA